MHHLIHIRDELVLEAHLDADEPHIRRARRCAGGSRRRRHPISALGSMAAERTGVIVGDPDEKTE
jgi:hypothetical protein